MIIPQIASLWKVTFGILTPACTSSPCKYPATCHDGYNTTQYSCECENGYSGTHCDEVEGTDVIMQ